MSTLQNGIPEQSSCGSTESMWVIYLVFQMDQSGLVHLYCCNKGVDTQHTVLHRCNSPVSEFSGVHLRQEPSYTKWVPPDTHPGLVICSRQMGHLFPHHLVARCCRSYLLYAVVPGVTSHCPLWLRSEFTVFYIF